ncbi:hypothetical protein B7R87_22680 [Streptomyces tsukubensis]|nr:hypothetical protein B7R87_22680 [Streptomyces tsukubensis]
MAPYGHHPDAGPGRGPPGRGKGPGGTRKGPGGKSAGAPAGASGQSAAPKPTRRVADSPIST